MKGIHILRSSVILSAAGNALSAFPAESKDPYAAGCARSLLAPSHGHRRRACSGTIAFFLLLTALASAQTLTGTAKNVTTGKPASGDEVVLLSLGQGMEEAGRTKTDSKGNFSFKLDNAQTPHLVRVIHQEVTYHRMAPPGTTSVNVEVYDVGKKIEGIEVVADIMRVQAEQGSLEIMRQFAVQNSSKPPRTQMNERNLEFYVPEGAQILDASAMTEGGNPLNSAPVPVDDKKTRYAFLFPLRPGTTQFEVAYQLPYTGSANIDPKSIYPLEHFVAMLPKAMQFAAAPGTNFELKDYPRQPDANVEVASGIKVGQPLAFKISGAGTLASGEAGEASAGGQAPPAQAESRPGGGLGPPIDAPDPLQKYRWWILGGFALALVLGGVFVASRQQAANRIARSQGAGASVNELEEEDDYAEVSAVREARPNAVRPGEARAIDGRFSETRSRLSPSRSSTSMLLEGLKEELFELEVEHKQGRISQKEYETAKSALDHTLERALKREAAKQG
jgi:hypothetical protein